MLTSLQSLLVSQLRDLYSAERQVLLIWPQLAQRVGSSALRATIEAHRAETGVHLARLIEILDSLSEPAIGIRSRGMEGLLVELLTQLSRGGESAICDAVIVAGCQRVESYEMAGYASAVTLARVLGHARAAALLGRTLAEEEAARRRLELIATTEIHPRAIAETIASQADTAVGEAIPIASARSRRGRMRV